MTDHNPDSGTAPGLAALSLTELAHRALILASLVEGLDVLHEQTDGDPDCTLTKRARNAIRPMLENTIAAAWALTLDIEAAERAENERRKVQA